MIGVSSTEFSAYRFDEVITEVSKVFEHWEIFAEAEHRLPTVERWVMSRMVLSG